MGMSELSPSLAPRNQMNRIFFFFPSGPSIPIVPSARACFITKGMSTRVDRATAILALAELLRKLRRVIRLSVDLGSRIKLLFLETLQCHQHGHHTADASVVDARRH